MKVRVGEEKWNKENTRQLLMGVKICIDNIKVRLPISQEEWNTCLSRSSYFTLHILKGHFGLFQNQFLNHVPLCSFHNN